MRGLGSEDQNFTRLGACYLETDVHMTRDGEIAREDSRTRCAESWQRGHLVVLPYCAA